MEVRALAVAALASMAVLTGCSKPEDPAQFDAADNAKCVSYGHTPGTPAYTDCRLKIERQRAMMATVTRPLPPPDIKGCPTEASGFRCINPSAGR
jgi:hypothetical protein